MSGHPFDAVFADLFEPCGSADLADIAVFAVALGAPATLIQKRERSAFILAMSQYCRCGHRQSYHDGSVGSCRYDECGCCGWMPE